MLKKKKKKRLINVNELAQLLVLFLQAAFNVQQVIGFLLELLLGGSQRTELLVLGLQVVLSQVTLLCLLLNLQRQVLYLKKDNMQRVREMKEDRYKHCLEQFFFWSLFL